MLERQENLYNQNIDPDPFTKDFDQKLNDAIKGEVKDTLVKGGTKAVVCALPFALSACSGVNPDSIHLNLNEPVVLGHIVGAFSAVEEAFEKDNKEFLRRALSIGLKYVAGFTGAHAVASNMKNGGYWISSENMANTITLIPASYVLYKETSLHQLVDGLKNGVVRKSSNISESRKLRDQQRELKHLVHDAYHPNLRIQYAAREKAQQMGISRDLLSKIHRGEINVEDLR